VTAIGTVEAEGRELRGLAALPWWARFLRDPIRCLTSLRARHGPLFALRNPVSGGGHGSRFVFALAPEYNRRAMLDARQRTGVREDDVITALIGAREARAPWMRDRDVVGQATMLFAASYETTANAMAWTLFLLSQHRQVAEDLASELDGALRGGAPGLDALEDLPLLDAVLRESMRIFPPVPYAIRLVGGGGSLGPLSLRDRDRVIVSHYVTHHLPELYPDPERFDPQRWQGLRRGPYEYLPFGAGPRTCIGINFANAAMKLALAAIASRFRLSLVPGTRVDRVVAVTLSPRGPLPMRLCAPGSAPLPAPVAGNVREMVRLPA